MGTHYLITPKEEYSDADIATYLKWQDSNDMTKCYILASLSEMLQ